MSAPPDTERDRVSASIQLDPRAQAAVARLRRVVVPTDGADASLARTREVALQLAREHDFDVVLYDRSDERWTDTPHPSGPFTVDQIDDERRPHLVVQLRDFAAAGVTATAWLATVPALTAMLDVLQELDVDGVLVPEHLDKPRIMDRLQVGSDTAAMVDRVAELQLPSPPTVLVVPESGAIRITSDEENS
jgi:anti-sigma factor RsiW